MMEPLYLLDFLSTQEKLSSQVNYICFHVLWSFKCSTCCLTVENSLSKYFSYVWGWTPCILIFQWCVVNQIITAHKAIYNLFGSGIYNKPHSIFKSKSYEFNNSNIVSFSGNDTRMDGYFIGMHSDLRMRKALFPTISSDEFNTMALKSKLSKVVLYIQYDKAW